MNQCRNDAKLHIEYSLNDSLEFVANKPLQISQDNEKYSSSFNSRTGFDLEKKTTTFSFLLHRQLQISFHAPPPPSFNWKVEIDENLSASISLPKNERDMIT